MLPTWTINILHRIYIYSEEKVYFRGKFFKWPRFVFKMSQLSRQILVQWKEMQQKLLFMEWLAHRSNTAQKRLPTIFEAGPSKQEKLCQLRLCS